MSNRVIGAKFNGQEIAVHSRNIIKGRYNRHDVDLYLPLDPGGSAQPPTQLGTLIWDADFSAISGTAPPATDWTLFDNLNAGEDFGGGPPKSSNHFIDGNGNLILRVQREPGGWRGPTSQYPTTAYFSGSFLGTFGYGTGWPTTGPKKHVFTPPFALEARCTYPDMPGGWGGLWMNAANKNNTTQGVVEIDWGEERMSRPTQWSGHQHWKGNDSAGTSLSDNSPLYPYSVPSVSTELRATPHIYRLEVYATGIQAMRPRYFLDGVLKGTGPAIANSPDGEGSLQTDVQLGLMIDWRQAPLGRWGSAYNETGPHTISGDATTNAISCASHGLASGAPIQFYDLVGGSGLVGRVSGQPPSATNYYVRDVTTNTFKVATTVGGVAVSLGTSITSGKIARGGGNYPPPSVLGPWDLTIEYVRAYDLTGVTPP